jgi:hypothetical protein
MTALAALPDMAGTAYAVAGERHSAGDQTMARITMELHMLLAI